MEKGKVKSEKKYISILFIPHFSANVKSIKFSAVYKKLVAAIVIFVLLIGSLISFVIYSAFEVRKFKEKSAELSGMNAEQKKLLEEKDAKVNSLEAEKDEFDSKTRDFIKKYRELTDSYISRGLSSGSSGKRSPQMLVKDINDLKSLLDDIKTISGTKEDLSATEEKLNEYLDAFPTLWPAKGPITSDFGARKDPFVKNERFHTGLDIAASYGSGIKAAAKGTVVLAEKTNVYGRTVIIDHGHGIKTFYGHASKLLVKEGETVEKGDIIANVGSSGRSTGAHLHFEVRINNTSVDPLKYLDNK